MTSDYVITNDRGGTVIEYALKAAEIERSGRRLVIKGRCASACTIYLRYPKTCVTPSASLQFHAPYGASPHALRAAKAYLLKSYPAKVRAWIARQGGLTSRLLTLRGRELMARVKACV